MEKKRKKSRTPSKRVTRKSRPDSKTPKGLVLLIRLGILVVITSAVIFWLKPSKPSPAASPSVQTAPSRSPMEIAQSFIDSNAPLANQPFEYTVDGVKVSRAFSNWGGHPMKDVSVIGKVLNINKKIFKEGIGTQAPSVIVFELNGKVRRFSCQAGADIEGGGSNQLIFAVKADNKKVYQSPKVVRANEDPVSIDLNVAGVKELSLVVAAHGDDAWKQADWVDLHFTKAGSSSE